MFVNGFEKSNPLDKNFIVKRATAMAAQLIDEWRRKGAQCYL
jgi:hypothetical protein